MRESPRGGLDFAELSTEFPQAVQNFERHPGTTACKCRTNKYLYRMETLWQVQENNTTFIFWLLPRGIPEVRRGKSARIGSRASGFRQTKSKCSDLSVWGLGSTFSGGSRKPSLNAFYTQESHRPQDGPRL